MLVHCFSTKVVDLDPDPEELASLPSTCAFQLGHQCQLSDAAAHKLELVAGAVPELDLAADDEVAEV